MLISSINAEESKSSSNKNDTITTPLDVSSSNSSQPLNSTKKASDTREKRNLSGFGTNFQYTNKNNNNNYYSSVPKAAGSTAQRRSSSGGYPYNSNYDLNSLDNNKINLNNQKSHLHNHLTSNPHDFVKNQHSHYRTKHVIKNNQENGNFFIHSYFILLYRPVFHFPLFFCMCVIFQNFR